MRSIIVGTTIAFAFLGILSGVQAVITPDRAYDAHNQARHPITGSLPPQGARCRAHAKEDVYWNANVNITDPPAPLWLNESLVPITWNFSEHCPMTPPDWEWSCCAHAQYNEMVSKGKILNELLSQCPACQKAMRNLFCWYTCGPYQYYTNTAAKYLPETGQVLTTQFAVDYETSQRIWHSCENAVLGIATLKDTFVESKVEGLFGLITSFAPDTTIPNGSKYKILDHVKLVPTCDPDAINWNMTTPECDYACSNPEFPNGCPTKKPDCTGKFTFAPGEGSGSFTQAPSKHDQTKSKRPYYPLPEAKIGSLPAQHFVAIILAVLLGLIGIVGFLNRDTHETDLTPRDEDDDNDNSGRPTKTVDDCGAQTPGGSSAVTLDTLEPSSPGGRTDINKKIKLIDTSNGAMTTSTNSDSSNGE